MLVRTAGDRELELLLNRLSPKVLAALIALVLAGGIGALATVDFDEDDTDLATDDPTTTTTVEDDETSTTLGGTTASTVGGATTTPTTAGGTATTVGGSTATTTGSGSTGSGSGGTTATTAPSSGLGSGGTGEVAAGRDVTAETGGELFLVPGMLAAAAGLGLRRLRRR